MHSIDKIEDKYKIAVIGGGAAGINYVNNLVHLIMQNKFSHSIQISVFDPGEIGSGLAYQEDAGCLLLNVRAKTMTVENSIIGNFNDWCNRKGYSNDKNGENYLQRYLFGLYLKDLFHATVELASKHNITLHHVKEEVIDINKHDTYQINTKLYHYKKYNCVMLAIGNTDPSDHYNLSGKNGYINNPYPINKNIIAIPKKENIAILGSGLTAVDVAIALIENKHQGSIKMYSRTGIFPSVRGVTTSHKMKFLTHEALEKIISVKHEIQLKDIYKLIKKELRSVGEHARKLFFHEPSSQDMIKYISREISNAGSQNKWQSVLVETNSIIEEYWEKLNQKDKAVFLKNYHSMWMTKRSPMPVANANKIKLAFVSGQLEIIDGIRSIKHTNAGFNISTSRYQDMIYQYIVNATGPARKMNNIFSSPLIDNLLTKGYAKEHIHGGIDVDFESSSVVDKWGAIDFNFRAIGHITCGTYYYTSSFVMTARKAKKIATEVVKSIKECDQNKLLIPSADEKTSVIDQPIPRLNGFQNNMDSYLGCVSNNTIRRI